MPIRNGVVYCVNHPSQPLQRGDEFQSLVATQKKGDAINFELGRGVPLVIHTCPVCGYVELYFAPTTSFWKKDSPK